jgi:hypothetical protein
MNERGRRVRFIPWSEPAASAQQDRLRKCSLTFVATRTALTRTTQQAGQHDDQQWPESSGQKRQASGLDRKSLTDWLGPNELLDGDQSSVPLADKVSLGADSFTRQHIRKVAI